MVLKFPGTFIEYQTTEDIHWQQARDSLSIPAEGMIWKMETASAAKLSISSRSSVHYFGPLHIQFSTSQFRNRTLVRQTINTGRAAVFLDEEQTSGPQLQLQTYTPFCSISHYRHSMSIVSVDSALFGHVGSIWGTSDLFFPEQKKSFQLAAPYKMQFLPSQHMLPALQPVSPQTLDTLYGFVPPPLFKQAHENRVQSQALLRYIEQNKADPFFVIDCSIDSMPTLQRWFKAKLCTTITEYLRSVKHRHVLISHHDALTETQRNSEPLGTLRSSVLRFAIEQKEFIDPLARFYRDFAECAIAVRLEIKTIDTLLIDTISLKVETADMHSAYLGQLDRAAEQPQDSSADQPLCSQTMAIVLDSLNQWLPKKIRATWLQPEWSVKAVQKPAR